MSIVAWRILWMTWMGRLDPNAKADVVFSEGEWKSIWLRYFKREIKQGLRKPEPPSEPMPLRQAIRWMAMRAGTYRDLARLARAHCCSGNV